MSINSFAPVVLFTYNRADHVKKVVDALSANIYSDQTELYVYSDAAKGPVSEDGVHNTREYLKTITGFKKITIIERPVNMGLAGNIIDGVTKIVNKHGRIIVLEDDLITSPYFLKFMNEALELYQNNNKVACVHGYTLPCDDKLPYLYFLRGIDCWGWATWNRAWKVFNPDGKYLLNKILESHQEKKFDYDFSCGYMQMLRDQIAGKNNSWAIRWQASVFLEDMYTLYPGHSLIKQIGFDSEATHCQGVSSDRYDVELFSEPIDITKAPLEVSQSKTAYRAYKHTYQKNQIWKVHVLRIFSLIFNRNITSENFRLFKK